jgi:hypothetical protein
METRQITGQPFADCLVMPAQPIAKAAPARRQQLLVQRGKARRMRHRHQGVPPDEPDQTLHLALVVALAGTAEPIRKQVMRLQLAEGARALPAPIAQDPRDRQLGVVIQDRCRHLAEERERRNVTGTERLRRLRRIGLHKTGIAVRQVHGEEVDLPFHPADHRQRLAEVSLRMPGVVPQRHEHLALALTARQNIVPHNRQPAGIAVLIAQALENPLHRVPLLRRAALILLQDPVNDAGERIQLGPLRRLAAPIPGRHRERQHLRHRPRVDAEPTRRLTTADPLNLNRVADPPIQLHELHPQPSAFDAESFLPLEFYSGATGQPGRFSGGFSLRRLHAGLDKRLRDQARDDAQVRLLMTTAGVALAFAAAVGDPGRVCSSKAVLNAGLERFAASIKAGPTGEKRRKMAVVRSPIRSIGLQIAQEIRSSNRSERAQNGHKLLTDVASFSEHCWFYTRRRIRKLNST